VHVQKVLFDIEQLLIFLAFEMSPYWRGGGAGNKSAGAAHVWRVEVGHLTQSWEQLSAANLNRM
jgi:hypothetical protein